MVNIKQKELLEKILHSINSDFTSFRTVCVLTGLNARTLKRNLEVIEFLQNADKVEFYRDGFRVLMRKTENKNSGTKQLAPIETPTKQKYQNGRVLS